MKNFLPLIFVLLLTVNFQIPKTEPKLNEGIITLQYTYPDADQVGEKLLAVFPTEEKVYFKNGNSRIELKDVNNTIAIIDGKTLERFSMSNSKLVIKSSKEERQKQTEMMYGNQIKITSETKDIAGYKCQKAIVTYKPWERDNRTMEIWFTNELAANSLGDMEFKGINGFIMEMSYTDIVYPKPEGVDFRILMTCKKVEQTSISDDMFKLPEEAVVKTKEEMRKNTKVEFH